jgi:hypothetical protein
MIVTDDFAHRTKNGELDINLRPHLECHLRFGPWSRGFRLYEPTETGWDEQHWEPGFILLHTGRTVRSCSVAEGFLQDVPDDIRIRVQPFQHCQYTLLRLLAQSTAARDLLKSNPVLLWLIADLARVHGWTAEAVERLLRQSRAKIIERFFAANGKNAERFLRKLVVGFGDSRELNIIQTTLASPNTVRALCRFQVIPIQALVVANRLPQLVNTSLVQAFLSGAPQKSGDIIAMTHRLARLWDDTFRLAYVLGYSDSEQTLSRCKRVEDLQTLHDRWTERLNRRSAHPISGDLTFPQPPLADTEQIIAIRNPQDLAEEGRLMHHCVASYTNDVFKGRSFIYRVLAPQRGTLQLGFKNGELRILQFKLAWNRHPSEESHSRVRKWLASYTGV